MNYSLKSILNLLMLSVGFVSFSCAQNTAATEAESKSIENIYPVKTFQYDSLTIPIFFKSLVDNHLADFYEVDSASYLQLCENYKLSASDNQNKETWFTLNILHELFTSQSAENCSKGEILHIPYYWHWVIPNPRYEIYFTQTGKLLSETKPPKAFSKYRSYADIDRTPYLFLSDLFEQKPKYYAAGCDTFATFGWCSEREMAFVALAKLLNYEGKVVAENNHSWSECWVPMKTPQGDQNFKVKVDNTFDSFHWQKAEETEYNAWKKYSGKSTLANWYNQKANSATEQQQISRHFASKEAMERLEMLVVEYLQSEISTQ